MNIKTPNPGSDAAVKLGCRCARMDNAYGRGAYGTSGDGAVFFITEGCPVHGVKSETKAQVQS